MTPIFYIIGFEHTITGHRSFSLTSTKFIVLYMLHFALTFSRFVLIYHTRLYYLELINIQWHHSPTNNHVPTHLEMHGYRSIPVDRVTNLAPTMLLRYHTMIWMLSPHMQMCPIRIWHRSCPYNINMDDIVHVVPVAVFLVSSSPNPT